MSSPPTPSTRAPETPPKARKKRIGHARKLDRRVEPKPDGRYLIYYSPR